MNSVERVKLICKERKIPISKLEKDLGFANGYIGQLKKGSFPGDRLSEIANYFDVSADYLLGRTAFKNRFELFEHWGYSAEGFEASFDFGELLKETREAQGISTEEISQALGITVSDVEDIEDGVLPLNYEWAEKYAQILDTSVSQIFFDNNMYDEQVPEQFHSDVKKYETLKKETEEEAYFLSQREEQPSIKSDPNYLGNYKPKNLKRIPILGRISAGLPLYAEEQIEGYTYTELNGGAEYFGLRVKGDSMNAARICEGDVIIVRKQPCVENGEVAVVMVDGENATVKKFYKDGNRVTLMPVTTNPVHLPQFYNLKETKVKILGKVVKNEILF